MEQVNLTIDGKAVSVAKGMTVLEAASLVGVEIPHYCYHPGLSIAGNCRMCLIEVEKMPKPMIGCNTMVSEGMVVKTQTENVKKMRQSVMEFLLINHPLDCPTCDQAGECRLQDYYMQFDEIPSRFAETKVHKDKMIDLGAGVMLDQERCVACTRCIRFCKEVAGLDELGLANRGDHVTITTFPGKPMTNAYAGNVVDICPVGALTNKDFRFKKRVWMLSTAPSICPGCSRGCNIDIHHADSKVYRLLPRYNKDVNQYWMCDEGRMAYREINEDRLLRHLISVDGELTEVTHEDALESLKNHLKDYAPEDVVWIAHAGETNETLEAWRKTAKDFGSTRFYYSRNNPLNPSEDNILRTADKNPNQKGINTLGFKPLRDLKEGKIALVLRDLDPEDAKILQDKKISIVALWAVHKTSLIEQAKIIFPLPSYAEQDGSFMNGDGRVQKITKAFEPLGEAMPMTSTLTHLMELMSSRS